MRDIAQTALAAAIFGVFTACAVAPVAAQEAQVWRGIGLQVTPGGKDGDWPVEVTLDGKGGRIEYPSLACGGTLTALGAGLYRETITHGANCVSGGTIHLYPAAKATAWFWTGEGTIAPDISASAILYPASPPVS